jgi:hypothetical protein
VHDCPKDDFLVLEDLQAEVILRVFRVEARLDVGELSHFLRVIYNWILNTFQTNAVRAISVEGQDTLSVLTHTATLKDGSFRVFGAARWFTQLTPFGKPKPTGLRRFRMLMIAEGHLSVGKIAAEFIYPKRL